MLPGSVPSSPAPQTVCVVSGVAIPTVGFSTGRQPHSLSYDSWPVNFVDAGHWTLIGDTAGNMRHADRFSEHVAL